MIDEAPSRRPADSSAVVRMTGALAMLGGMLCLAVAALVTVSVLRRWITSQPIDGDVEYVQMATALAVFLFLPYCQTRRGNIAVDTFTSRLPERAQRITDALHDLVYALSMGVLTYCLYLGTLGMRESGTTMMATGVPIWPALAASTVLCAVLTVSALYTAGHLLRRRP